jgi:UDP-glucose:(heptosyl)LPS alpha-1,3-glucosyltransferase
VKLAFVLFKYFPFGGLQRDMLRIAQACQQRGHEIHIYTLSWQGEVPEAFQVHQILVKRITNHARYMAFYQELQPLLREQAMDGVVGFNKMPGLDFYYAADPCFKEKLDTQKNWLTRGGTRNRLFLQFEAAVFAPASRTKILMISPQQLKVYTRHYRTPRERIHLLPPGISRDRMAPPDAAAQRAAFRQEFRLGPEDRLMLTVGSGFKVKGLDRTLRALASLPEELRRRTRLFVIGQDNPAPFLRLAGRLGVAERMTIFPGRDDIPRFLLGADLMVHPAYYENTGTVLLEALIAGLPVLTTDTCGYAFHVERAEAGRVVRSPFDQRQLNRDLAAMLSSRDWSRWSANGVAYGFREDLYSMPELAARIIIETIWRRAC